MNKLKIYILIWLPASGKSTYIEENISKDWIIISSDSIRLELFWDENNQENNVLVFSTLFDRLSKFIKNKQKEIYIDATNISSKDRKKIFNIIKINNKNKLKDWALEKLKNMWTKNKLSQKEIKEKYFYKNYEIIWVYFETDIQTLIKRDSERKRTVWEYVILRMLSRLEKPNLSEWFDKINYIKNNNNINKNYNNKINYNNKNYNNEIFLDNLKKFLNWENNLKAVLENDFFLEKSIYCEQTSKWHKETLFEHLELILSLISNKIEKKYIKILKLITIFHDIWKPFTKNTKKNNLLKRWYKHIWGTKFKKKNWEIVEIENYEDFQFLWHEIFSSNIFSLNYQILLIKNNIINEKEANLIETVIRWHLDFHKNIWNKSIKINNIIYWENTEIFKIWTLFSKYDSKWKIWNE